MAFDKYGFNANKTKYDLDNISIAALEKRVTDIENNLLKKAYPVGSVYFSTNKTNPGNANVLGFGTWARVSDSQRFLVLTPDNGSTSARATGGENEVMLSASNIPDHAHRLIVTTSDNTKDPKNKWGASRGKIDPFERVRVIPIGTGGETGTTPWNLAYTLFFRRGYGSDVTIAKHTPNDNTTITPKNQTPADEDHTFNNSFALETTAGAQKQTQVGQEIIMDITSKTKITGFTGKGIYTEDAWANSTINGNGTVTYTDLSQQKVDKRPAYVTLYAWYRTA